MSAGWWVVLGALVAAVAGFLSSFLLQLRNERRRILGAARMVLLEIRRNAEAAEWYFDPNRPHAVPRAGLEELALRLETHAWDVHSAELAHRLSDELIDRMEGVYYDLRRTSVRAPRAGSDWANELRSLEIDLRPIARKTWRDRYVWRI